MSKLIKVSDETWKILNDRKVNAESFESVIKKLLPEDNKKESITEDPKPILNESEIDEVIF